jgi:Xaa-Pro aminopeptidase
MVSASMHNADMYYATRFLAADPFVYLRLSHKDILIVPQMEYERAKKESIVNEVRASLDYGHDLKTEELITNVLHEQKSSSQTSCMKKV